MQQQQRWRRRQRQQPLQRVVERIGDYEGEEAEAVIETEKQKQLRLC